MTDLAVGTTLTARLQLEPVGLGHIEDPGVSILAVWWRGWYADVIMSVSHQTRPFHD